MTIALAVSKQVLVMALIAIAGLTLKKCGKIDDNMKSPLSNLMMYLVSPMLVLNSFIKKFDKTEFQIWLVAAALGILVHVVYILLSKLIFADKNDPQHAGISRFAVVFSNAGFIGIPLVQAAIGNEGVFFLVGYIAASGLFMWSTGAKDISGGSYKLSAKKILVNPTMIATYIALPIYLLQIPLGAILTGTIGYICNLNTALSMIFIGILIADVDIKGLFTDKMVLKTAAVRLIVFPLIALVLGFGLNLIAPGKYIIVIMTILIAASAPSASATAMMATIFKSDDVYGGKIVSCTTVLCMLSIPAVLLLAGVVIR